MIISAGVEFSNWVQDSSGHLVPTGAGLEARAQTIGILHSTLAVVAQVKAHGSGTDGVIQLLNAAGNGFGRLCLGGTSATDPALKKSSSTLEAKVGDDSAYAGFNALQFTLGSGAGQLSSSGLALRDTIGVLWSSTSSHGGTKDAGVVRDSAGVVRVSDGSTGAGQIRYRRSVATNTADATLVVTQSGSVLDNSGAAGQVIYTLPAGSAGAWFTFYVTTAQNLRIKGNGAEQIRNAASISTATTGYIEAATVGNAVTVVWMGSFWAVVSLVGTWTVA